MTRAQTSQLYAVVITAVVLGFVVMRRIRPQEVRPNRLLVGGAVIVLLVAFSLVGTGGGIVGDPLALALIPVFVVAGGLLGFLLVRTMTFWSDPNTGALWMRGGAVFALILVGAIVLRFGVRAVLTGIRSAPGASTRRSSTASSTTSRPTCCSSPWASG
jgi:hypothetical protein